MIRADDEVHSACQGSRGDVYHGVCAAHRAAACGCLSCLKEWIASGRDVNVRDYYGATPLIWAAYRGQVEAVRFLLRAGASPRIADVLGRTALDWAEEREGEDYAECCRLLKQAMGIAK